MPVPRRRRGQGGLQDFHPEQSSFAFGGADHRIDSAVRARFGHGGLQGSHPRQSSTCVLSGCSTRSSRFSPRTGFIQRLPVELIPSVIGHRFLRNVSLERLARIDALLAAGVLG